MSIIQILESEVGIAVEAKDFRWRKKIEGKYKRHGNVWELSFWKIINAVKSINLLTNWCSGKWKESTDTPRFRHN